MTVHIDDTVGDVRDASARAAIAREALDDLGTSAGA